MKPCDIICADPDALVLSKAWQAKTISTQGLVPGTGESGLISFRKHLDLNAMHAENVHSWLLTAFSSVAGSVDGKSKQSKTHVLLFRGRSIMSFTEPGRGTSWELVLGSTDKPEAEGRSYGRHVLLSSDKEVAEFWPDFCSIVGKAMALDPLAFKAELDTCALTHLLPVPKGSRPAPAPRL